MKKVLFIVFSVVPLLLAVLTFALPDKSFSANENRTLKTKDQIKLNIKDSIFQDSLEEYFSDQFPGREKLKACENLCRYTIGQREIGGAYISSDGRLFQAIKESDIDEKACISYAKKINTLAKDTGIPVSVIYVPSSCISLKDKLPNDAPVYDYDALYGKLQNELGDVNLIDVSSVLYGKDSLYYRTDHHWTAKGAYAAYSLWAKKNSIAPLPYSAFDVKTVDDDFLGTLYAKVLFNNISHDSIEAPAVSLFVSLVADGEKIPFYDESALTTKDKYNYFQGGNHGICEISNPSCDNNMTLLVLKDSFANSFVPYLTGHYSRIYMIDERYTFIDVNSFAKEIGADEVLVLKEIIS